VSAQSRRYLIRPETLEDILPLLHWSPGDRPDLVVTRVGVLARDDAPYADEARRYILHLDAEPVDKCLLDALSARDPDLPRRVAAGENLHPVVHWG